MAIAAFKDLCLDASDAGVVGGFWADALGLRLERQAGGDTVVRGGPLHILWVNQVPEPKAGKNRVHLDVYGRDPGALAALGATVLADHGAWVVLGDPEGNELCVFPDPDPDGPGGVPARPFALCVDSAEPEALAAWWAGVFEGTVGPGPDGTPRWIHGAAGLDDVVMKCVRVPDPRVAKNRCHWDVTTEDVDRLVAAGATVLRRPGQRDRLDGPRRPAGQRVLRLHPRLTSLTTPPRVASRGTSPSMRGTSIPTVTVPCRRS